MKLPVTENRPRSSWRRRVLQSRSARLAMLAATAVGFIVIWFAANLASSNEETGLVFVIPAGASASLAIPGIDSAIAIPTDIQFGPDDVAKITVRNEDSVVNRAGPWVIEAGQTYTARFDEPGTYQFDCSVDASESVTVTVSGESSPS